MSANVTNRDEFNHASQRQPNGGRERQLDRSAEVAGRQLIHEQGEVIGGRIVTKARPRSAVGRRIEQPVDTTGRKVKSAMLMSVAGCGGGGGAQRVGTYGGNAGIGAWAGVFRAAGQLDHEAVDALLYLGTRASATTLAGTSGKSPNGVGIVRRARRIAEPRRNLD